MWLHSMSARYNPPSFDLVIRFRIVVTRKQNGKHACSKICHSLPKMYEKRKLKKDLVKKEFRYKMFFNKSLNVPVMCRDAFGVKFSSMKLNPKFVHFLP